MIQRCPKEHCKGILVPILMMQASPMYEEIMGLRCVNCSEWYDVGFWVNRLKGKKTVNITRRKSC